MSSKYEKFFLNLYVFLAIFEPPILPVSFIYVLGCITIFFIILRDQGNIDLSIFKETTMNRFYGFFIFLSIYMIIVSLVDILFVSHDFMLINRLKGLNQLLILTGIQFLNIEVILHKVRSTKGNIYVVYDLIINCASIQGVLSILAYLIPTVRSLFLKFSSDLYQNPWLLERRGYGFSSSLIDLFGYGMGLAAGYALFTFNRHKFMRIIQLLLIMFSIWFNSRTGLIVFIIAVFLKIIENGNLFGKMLKISGLGVSLIYSFYIILPKIIEIGLKSMNATVKWIVTDFGGVYDSLMKTNYVVNPIQNVNQDSTYYMLLQDLVKTPDNLFQKYFGTGYSVYSAVNGYRTDVGYTNITWMFGLLGTILFCVFIIYNFRMACLNTSKKEKTIIIFNLISYFIVLVKGRLIGYGPGIFVNYLILFATIYFSRKNEGIDGEVNEKI